MGLAIETILGYNGSLTGSTTFDALTPGTGNSFAVRSFVDGSEAFLEDIWMTDDTSAFQLSIKSPRMHDQVKGILLAGTNQLANAADAARAQSLFPGELMQRLYSTDVLEVTANGASSDKVCALFNVRYENLGGIAARLYSWEQIAPLIVNYVGILTQPITSATAGQWGAGVALNALDDRLKSDTDYALVGYQSAETITGFSIQGTDTGNLRIGGPGFWDQRWGGDFFVRQSMSYRIPHIPVINANNKGSTLIAIADTDTSNTVNVTPIFAQLSQKLANPSG